jgi:hypothetical protein
MVLKRGDEKVLATICFGEYVMKDVFRNNMVRKI